jgi:DNA-binding NarL/FixJ family response regulator
VRLVIAEDSGLLREGLTRLLAEAGFDVVDAVPDAEQLLRSVGSNLPDVVVADVRMPPTHSDEGLRAALVIRQRWPGTAVLVVSQYVEERYATDLLATDTRGVCYLPEGSGGRRRRVHRGAAPSGNGGTALDPEVVAQLLIRGRRRPRRVDVRSHSCDVRSGLGAQSRQGDGGTRPTSRRGLRRSLRRTTSS